MKYIFIFLSLSLIFIFCSKKDTADQSAAKESVQTQTPESTGPDSELLIQTKAPRVIADDKFKTSGSGLKYFDLKVGTGKEPEIGDEVEVHYSGWLTSGKRFDSSVLRGKTFKFSIGQKKVIAGWDEGVLSMKEGGARQLVIPGHLAYGEQGYPGVIPPNATLIFEVQLMKVNKK